MKYIKQFEILFENKLSSMLKDDKGRLYSLAKVLAKQVTAKLFASGDNIFTDTTLFTPRYRPIVHDIFRNNYLTKDMANIILAWNVKIKDTEFSEKIKIFLKNII